MKLKQIDTYDSGIERREVAPSGVKGTPSLFSQPSPPAHPRIDGPGLTVADQHRLGAQLHAVLDLMIDHRWRTLAEIGEAVHAPEPSVSARLRDLRKPRNGGWRVERRRRGGPSSGLYEYQVAP